jgi:hypothetical protein
MPCTKGGDYVTFLRGGRPGSLAAPRPRVSFALRDIVEHGIDCIDGKPYFRVAALGCFDAFGLWDLTIRTLKRIKW